MPAERIELCLAERMGFVEQLGMLGDRDLGNLLSAVMVGRCLHPFCLVSAHVI